MPVVPLRYVSTGVLNRTRNQDTRAWSRERSEHEGATSGHVCSDYLAEIATYLRSSVGFSACSTKNAATSALFIPPIFMPRNREFSVR